MLGLRYGSRLELRLGDGLGDLLEEELGKKNTFTFTLVLFIMSWLLLVMVASTNENILILRHLNDGVLIDWYSILNLPLI